MDATIAELARVGIEEVAEEIYGPQPEETIYPWEWEASSWEGTAEYDG